MAEKTEKQQAAEEAAEVIKKKSIAKAAAKNAQYVIAEGKGITAVGRRILGPGDPVTAADLGGGESAFEAFIKTGHFVKKSG
jgi:hypothetical protein